MNHMATKNSVIAIGQCLSRVVGCTVVDLHYRLMIAGIYVQPYKTMMIVSPKWSWLRVGGTSTHLDTGMFLPDRIPYF